jgi:hypothetical protein
MKHGTYAPKRRHHKKRHARNFQKAVQDFLDTWEPGDPTEVVLRFEASISPNPGGVTEYRIIPVQK